MLRYAKLVAISTVTVFLSNAKTVKAMDALSGNQHVIQRLTEVEGINGKNDVIFCGESRSPKFNVIFFGGDVQNYKEKMLAHHENRRFANWDLESSAALLHRRFPNSHIWVVKPSQMIHDTFSIYSNFVRWKDHPSGSIGPVHEAGQKSWEHLYSLLTKAVHQMNAISKDVAGHCLRILQNTVCDRGIFSSELPTRIVGFSKGCVVLNQLAYDLTGLTQDSISNSELIKLVTDMYWLDGGHGGGFETWVTNDAALIELSRFEIHSHVTPYQMNDAGRPWINKEHEQFIDGLQKRNARVHDIMHFSDQKRSLWNHFRILEEF